MRVTQRKGDIATAQAIATFTKLNYDVSIPLTESAAYDLIVDLNGEKLIRVQVKYTSRKQVNLTNVHSNSKGYVVKKVKDKVYDWLYILWIKTDNTLEEHLIKECLIGRTSINLNGNTLFKEVVRMDEELVLKTSSG